MIHQCRHCGASVATADAFCCSGCEAAYRILHDEGLDLYYKRRVLDPQSRLLRPEGDAPSADYETYTRRDNEGNATLHLMVDGIQCAACVWLIETLLSRQPCIISARLNMTTRRLSLRWQSTENDIDTLLAPVLAIGYRLVPYDPARLADQHRESEKELLRMMGISGFAAGNVMLMSVSVWAGYFGEMGPATRDLMHWFSALIALPAIVYCIRPFLRSALGALRNGRTNMDVPICLGVLLSAGMSVFETLRHGEYAYFDAGITLLFFLLIGRYLDSRARARARSAAEDLIMLRAKAVTVIDDHGHLSLVAPEAVRTGMTVLVATGEQIGVDGTILEGRSDVDVSLISGESLPSPVCPGDNVFAGTLNLSAPLRLRVTATEDQTLLAGIVRLMEAAEGGRAGYRALADRVARLYAPVVHLTALITFIGWMLFGDIPWQQALLYAVSVLIITCPCALALAVPVVQVVAAGWLMRRGILLKSATALERMATIDTVVFDKTGTLTTGRLELQASGKWTQDDLHCAASLAQASTHPLSRALVRACPEATIALNVEEHPGAGLQSEGVRLGSRRWCGVVEKNATSIDEAGPELWLARPGKNPVRFSFVDQLREDARQTIETLQQRGLQVEILSGDRTETVATVAHLLGISQWKALCTPTEKHDYLATQCTLGKRVLMVGDGLNDAPALASAHVSLSPATAADVSQTAADIVFQGARLAPVATTHALACASQRLCRQNLGLALSYNVVTIPLAIAGYVTPLLAAIFMSASSIVVIMNALRLARGRFHKDNAS